MAGGVGSLHVQCQWASCGGVVGEEATTMSGRTGLAEGEHEDLLYVEGAEGHSVGDGEGVQPALVESRCLVQKHPLDGVSPGFRKCSA